METYYPHGWKLLSLNSRSSLAVEKFLVEEIDLLFLECLWQIFDLESL